MRRRLQLVEQALDQVSLHCHGHHLLPGALMSDHSSGCRAGMLSAWEHVPHGQCWPHIARKLSEGKFCSKAHPHLDTIQRHLRTIHMCQSKLMKYLFIQKISEVWDSWGEGLNMKSFWDTYLCEPWDNWSLGDFDCMLCTPSQQAHESWHKQLLQSRIPGRFKGSTEQVMHIALPRLVAMDAALIPDELLYTVHAVPEKMYQKALWYIQHETTHFRAVSDDEITVQFYFLSKSESQGYYRKMSTKLINRYKSLLDGERPQFVTHLESMIDILNAVRLVQYSSDAIQQCMRCSLNPAELVCNCKGYRHVEICAHVLATNHMLKQTDLLHAMQTISHKRKKGGNMLFQQPALIREDQPRRRKKKPTLGITNRPDDERRREELDQAEAEQEFHDFLRMDDLRE